MNKDITLTIDIEQSYQTYGGMVYRRCLKILQNEASALDVMQDVFVQLLNKQKQLTDKGLSSLLYQMATNLSLNLIDKQAVRQRYQQNQVLCDDDEIDQHSDLEARLSHEQILLNSLNLIDRRSAELAIYYHLDGYTIDEIAQLKQMSNSNIRRLLKQVRQDLMEFNKTGGSV